MLRRSVKPASTRLELFQARLLFYLFILTIGVFFVGGLLTYVIVRVNNPVESVELIAIPTAFLWSTFLLILISVCLQRSVWYVRRQKTAESLNNLVYGLLFSAAFVFVQWLGLDHLLQLHNQLSRESATSHGVFFFIAVLHGLHIFGGIIYIVFVLIQSLRDKYDHERHWAIDNCAGYWHFLGVVWLAMLATFYFVG